MPKRVLLTGIGGFIGAHCLQWWLENTDWEIIGIDSFRHKGFVRRIDEVERLVRTKLGFDQLAVLTGEQRGFNGRVKLFSHDLSVPLDPPLINQLMERTIQGCGTVTEKKIDFIVNMASDSAVERSTSNPIQCLTNNYNLTINMLEFARLCKPDVFIQISTDEVYGEAPPKPSIGHKEWAPIVPSNPYAASKAAQEAVAISYWRTFGVPVVLTNCMNVIGEMQDPEKMVPKIIQYVARGQEMPIYADFGTPGDPTDVSIGSRVYTDAKCKADALQYILAEIMGKELRHKLIPSESARPGYDRRYALDGSKLRDAGWRPPFQFDETIERIVHWTMANPHWMV
jgi:dTDP-glucose 4,6-dehydratase